jgi:hypothetical protein
MNSIDEAVTPEKKSRRKSFLVNGSIVCVSVLLALVLGEYALRAMVPESIVSDSVLGHKVAALPGWDADGFRNEKILKEAQIVAIGDSQTEGNNATREESWPQTLGVLASTTVYQMAVDGYGPAQYLTLTEKAIALKPRIVAVGFYTGNDLTDTIASVYEGDEWKRFQDPAFTEEGSVEGAVNVRDVLISGLPPDSLSFKIFTLRTWVRQHSKLYALLGNATRALREKMGVALTKEEKIGKVEELSKERPDLAYVYKKNGVETILSPMYRLDTVDLKRKNTKEGWRISQEIFLEMNDTLQKKHITFVMVIIPTKEMVYLEHMKKTEGSIPEQFNTYYSAERNLLDAVGSFCGEKHITCVETLPGMTRALEEGTPIYGKTMDGHPKAPGYKVIAESVYSFLKSKGVL